MKLFKYFIFIGLFLNSFLAFANKIAFRLENDCLIKHSDNDYSNGAGLEYWHDSWKFLIQQNMYTPSDIKIPYHIDGDRPYAGWLGFGIGKELFIDDQSPWTHFAQIDFGMIGPSSGAEQTQKFIHKILGCHEPKGWDDQLHNEFCVNGQWWTKYNWYLCDYVVIIPRAGILAGTIQDASEIGSDLKIGWNLRHEKDVGNTMMFSATQNKYYGFLENLVVYGFIGGDCRYYLYNHFLEGSLFNNKDDDVTVDPELFVGEFTFGGYIELYNIFVMYYGTCRSHEYDTQKESPNYGGLMIGYKFDF